MFYQLAIVTTTLPPSHVMKVLVTKLNTGNHSFCQYLVTNLVCTIKYPRHRVFKGDTNCCISCGSKVRMQY